LTEALAVSRAPVKLLLVIASPINDPRRLNPNIEITEIHTAFEQTRAPVDIMRLNPPTLENLRAALATQAFDIVHIAAHAGQGRIELEDDDGTVAHVTDDELAALFTGYRDSLLVLNGCSTEPLADRIGRDAPGITTLSVAPDIDRRDAQRIVSAIYRHVFTDTPEQLAVGAAATLKSRRLPGTGSPIRARGKHSGKVTNGIPLGVGRPTYYPCTPPSNIPLQQKLVVDRVTELLRLHDLLVGDSASGPFVGLVGIPGSGKTTLVEMIANHYGWHFPHGTGYFSFRGCSGALDLNQAFGWRRSSGVTPVTQAAMRLSGGRYLLILDEMDEAGPEAAAEVRSLLSAWNTTLGGRAILVFHARRADFQSMVGANWVTVRELPIDAASDLLTARLGGPESAQRTVGPDFAEASRLCLQHPRTIESAASLLQLGQRWADLRSDLQQLTGEGALAVNDEMLSRVIARLEGRAPVVRDLLDAWVVFEDGCLESTWRRLAVGEQTPAGAPKAQLDAALGELQGASLIDRFDSGDDSRCVMHPLLVAHLRRRHGALSEQRTRQLINMQLASLAQLLAAEDFPVSETANMMRALQLARQFGMNTEISAFCASAVGDQQLPLPRHGPWQTARDLLSIAVDAAEFLGDDLQTARFLIVTGGTEYRLASFGTANAAYERAATLAGNDPALRLLALKGRGQVLYRSGDMDGAEQTYLFARRLASNELAEADIDHQLAKIAYRRHDLARARSLLGRVRAAREKAGRMRDLAKTLHELARVEHAAGDLTAARQSYEEALRLERQANDPATEQATLFQLGRLALDDGRIGDASRLLDESRHLSTELRDEIWIVHADYGQALLAHAHGNHDAALERAALALQKSQMLSIGLAAEIQAWIDGIAAEQASH
jgi:tetratricopeptide (TPR) repeat protein